MRGCVCLCLRVCVCVCAWGGLEVAVQQPGPSGSLDPAEGWGLSDQQRRLLPAAAPGLDGFAAGAPSNSGAAQEPPEVTRGLAEEPRARSLAQPQPCASQRDLLAPPAPQTLGLPAPRHPPRWHRSAKRAVVAKPGPPPEMEVFSLILVVSVCWTRSWRAAIADSIIHIGKGVLRLPVPLLDTFPALLLQPSLLLAGFPPPRNPPSLVSLAVFAGFCSFPSLNRFPQGFRASSFPPPPCTG